MNRKSIVYNSFKNFVESDINDLIILFRNLNDGAHGNAGRFGIVQLLKLKKRSEDSILFITSFAE